MKPIDIAIVAVVVVLVVLAIRRAVGVAKGTRDCCSGDTRGEAPATCGVADTNPDHYPHEATLAVGGMTCEHCASRVESALNALGGTWATVNLAAGTALVRSKQELDEKACRTALDKAGYRLGSVSVAR